MKCILLSIRPQWVAKILNGEKTLEIRKSAPKDLPCEVYIYCTKGEPSISPFEFCENGRPPHIIGGEINGKVVAKFTLNKVLQIKKYQQNGLRYWAFGNEDIAKRSLSPCELSEHSCVSQEDLEKYLNGKEGYAWKISDLKIFGEPKELKEFNKAGAPTYEQTKAILRGGYTMEQHRKYLARFGYAVTKAPQSYCYCEAEE